MNSPVVIVPGIGNSGPEHWQSLWQLKYPEFIRVQQQDWDQPQCDQWVRSLARTVQMLEYPPVLVAHSLGCLTVAHWVAGNKAAVKGALLVAVPDPEGGNFPKQATGFGRLPQLRFPFPAVLVASTDDPYADIVFAQRCASNWGGTLIDVGCLGHINAQSGLGDWPRGLVLLDSLRG